MKVIKCKNDSEKVQAIKNYCNEQIKELKNRIEFFEHEKTSSLDYIDEIDELKTRKAHFEKILEIIQADEFTSVYIF